MTQLLLSVDVGNSRIKFGLFNRADLHPGAGALPTCMNSLAIPLADAMPWKTVQEWIENSASDAVSLGGVIAGANPAGIDRVVAAWPDQEWAAPEIVSQPDHFPLEVNVAAPRQVGIDRLLNAVAANRIRPPGRTAIIVDTGTATTVDLVTAEGRFAGGAIMPGFELSARALHLYTALLPLITIDELATGDHLPLGTDTREALRSGLFWGQLGAIRELTARMGAAQIVRPVDATEADVEESSAAAGQPMVLVTGGGGRLITDHLEAAQWLPHLSLQGLALVAGTAET